MSTETKENTPAKKSCSARGAFGSIWVLAMIPIAIVAIVHASDVKKAEKEAEQFKATLRLKEAMFAQGYSIEDIERVMKAGHPNRRMRPTSYHDVERTKLLVDLAKELSKEGRSAEDIAVVLATFDFDEKGRPRMPVSHRPAVNQRPIQTVTPDAEIDRAIKKGIAEEQRLEEKKKEK